MGSFEDRARELFEQRKQEQARYEVYLAEQQENERLAREERARTEALWRDKVLEFEAFAKQHGGRPEPIYADRPGPVDSDHYFPDLPFSYTSLTDLEKRAYSWAWEQSGKYVERYKDFVRYPDPNIVQAAQQRVEEQSAILPVLEPKAWVIVEPRTANPQKDSHLEKYRYIGLAVSVAGRFWFRRAWSGIWGCPPFGRAICVSYHSPSYQAPGSDTTFDKDVSMSPDNLAVLSLDSSLEWMAVSMLEREAKETDKHSGRTP